jgi:hypothetical protein
METEYQAMETDYQREFGLLARVLPHMFARWRLPRDLETLAGLPDGGLLIDALAGTARHERAGVLDLAIAEELRAGLDSHLLKKNIPRESVSQAMVIVVTDTSQVKTDRNRIVHFDFRIACRILADEGEFLGSQTEEHVWYERNPTPENG